MRTIHSLISLLVISLGPACPKSEQPAPTPETPAPAPTPKPGGLILVEAELAMRMQNGQLADDQFCEASVPFMELRGSTLEFQCGQEAALWNVTEETGGDKVKTLKTKQNKTVKLESSGRQRYKVTGSPCDKAPTFYIVYPEAKTFREQWLRSSACPAEDMRLAQ